MSTVLEQSHRLRLAAPASTPSPRARAAHLSFVVMVTVLGPAVLLGSPLVKDLAVMVGGVVPTVVLVVVLARREIPRRRPWAWVLGGLVVLDLHGVSWVVQTYAGARTPPEGLLTALGLPVGYVVVLVGAVALVRMPGQKDAGALLDAAIIALNASLLGWVVVLEPALRDGGSTPFSEARTLGTLIAISAIGGALARTAIDVPERRVSTVYLLTTVGLTLVGTLTRALTVSTEAPAGAQWVGMFWVVAYAALAAAALHPSARAVVTRPLSSGKLSRHRLLLLGGALAVAPTLLTVETIRGSSGQPLLIVVANLTLVVLVVLRVAQLAGRHADTEARLARLATHDELTDLPTRRVLDEHLERVVADVSGGRSRGAVIAFLDVDDFKEINDAHGHHTGDKLLVVVGERLRSVTRPHDLVARFAGDEFVVVLEGDPDQLLRDVLPRLRAALDAPVDLGDLVVPCRASVGAVAVRPGETLSAAEALSRADARMYLEKDRRQGGRT